MTETNGNGAGAILPLATELILSNGLRCWVYPVTQMDRLRILEKWVKEHPEPDKKGYERPVPAEDASFEGQTLSADSNPEYQNALALWRDARADYITNVLLLMCTEFPDYDKADLIARFARVIAQKRQVMDLPADAWDATVRFALIATIEDQSQIIRAVESRLPVEYGEIIDQVRIFRPIH